jgi:hypothetical protein
MAGTKAFPGLIGLALGSLPQAQKLLEALMTHSLCSASGAWSHNGPTKASFKRGLRIELRLATNQWPLVCGVYVYCLYGTSFSLAR